TSAGGNTATETYTLDALGNRIAHSQVSGAWEYDDNHRLTRKGSGNCGQSGVTCYQYDEAGNLTQKQTASQTRRYRYDTQNRLIQVQDGNDEPIARYGYDPLDRRIWKEQFRDASAQPLPQAQRTLYLYAHEGLIAEATQAIELGQGGITIDLSEPQITTQYGLWPDGQWGSGPLFIKTRNSNGQASYAYYHHDHRQTPVQATDKAGNIVWAANYNAFGQASITTPAPSADKPVITSQLRLPGQYEDPESGLYYNYRRYYDPETGRYISQDPIGLAGGLNRYRYAEADPINQIDPTGELALPLAPLAWGAARCMGGCMAGTGLWNAVFGSCDDLGDVTKNCALECAGGWALGKLFGKLRGLGGPP
ncbi:MAG: RHS repeat domain-containing protein, partial [bacterium]